MNAFSRCLALVGALSSAALLTLHAGPALVGHEGLAGQTLDADGVKAVLLGKKATLGSTRVVLVLSKASEAQEAFLKEYVGMTTDQLQTHWRRLFMSGGGSAPKVVENETEACELVAKTAGAVTVADTAKAGNLKVLAGK